MNITTPESFQAMLRPAQRPDQVLDKSGVPVQRVADVQAEPAVELVAGAQGGRCLARQPVGRHIEVRIGF
jgi:hypothetical protein